MVVTEFVGQKSFKTDLEKSCAATSKTAVCLFIFHHIKIFSIVVSAFQNMTLGSLVLNRYLLQERYNSI